MTQLHAVLLAGGSGTRLWPLSTREHPKQFMTIGNGPSLLQATWNRLDGLVPPENRWVVCGESHATQVRQQLPDLPATRILTEPQAKNTAAAIGLAALRLRAEAPDAVMAVLPADHFIPETEAPVFRRSLDAAFRVAAEREVLVTFGIRPSAPATGYGYLEKGAEESPGCFRVRAFHEKPDLPTAQKYAAHPDFFWNSGMFVWKAEVFLSELKKYLPKTALSLESLAPFFERENYAPKAVEAFSGLESVSVDYAVMEKSERVCMIPAAFSWDDVGSLGSLAAAGEGDSRGNHFLGDVISLDSEGNLVLGRSKTVVLLGVKDLLVMEGEKAILIAPRDWDQDVRRLVEFLKKSGREYLL
jgi:mannose-1-phosphate guanylyltransferase